MSKFKKNSNLQNKSHFVFAHIVAHEITESAGIIAKQAEYLMTELNSFSNALTDQNMLSANNTELLNIIKEIISVIHDKAIEAEDFTQFLLAFSDNRFQSRKQINLNDLINSEIQGFKNNPPPNINNIDSVDLKFYPCDEKSMCIVYKIPFIHIVRNIMANAYQAMDKKKGSLIIRTYLKNNISKEKICIDFSDSGKGIEPQHIKKILMSVSVSELAGTG